MAARMRITSSVDETPAKLVKPPTTPKSSKTPINTGEKNFQIVAHF
jgi:hypothetical protein